MGRFSSTVQVLNSKNISKEQFVSEFNNIIDSIGYRSSSPNDFDISYFLAFSTNGKWITLGSDDYKKNHQHVYDDNRQIAEKMHTSCFSVVVVDSDWANIELYTNSNIHDTVVVGRSEDFLEYSPKGRSEFWESLLNKGKTWDELSAIWNKNKVFVEDTLLEAASVLGIDPKYMVYDFKDFKIYGENDPNIIQLFFKKNHIQ